MAPRFTAAPEGLVRYLATPGILQVTQYGC